MNISNRQKPTSEAASFHPPIHANRPAPALASSAPHCTCAQPALELGRHHLPLPPHILRRQPHTDLHRLSRLPASGVTVDNGVVVAVRCRIVATLFMDTWAPQCMPALPCWLAYTLLHPYTTVPPPTSKAENGCGPNYGSLTGPAPLGPASRT